MEQHIETIAEVLLGAAYADKNYEGRERERIREVLCELLRVQHLPEAVEAQLVSFNPAKHDVDRAGIRLAKLTNHEKHEVLRLVASVTEVDNVVDLAEDAYLRRLADALDLVAEESLGLDLEFLDEDAVEHEASTDEASAGQ